MCDLNIGDNNKLYKIWGIIDFLIVAQSQFIFNDFDERVIRQILNFKKIDAIHISHFHTNL